MESPQGSSAGTNMSVEECQQLCLDSPGCDAIVRDVLNLTWDVHTAINCYRGHGATDLVDGSGSASDCLRMTESECHSQCFLTPGCTGVVLSADNTSG